MVNGLGYAAEATRGVLHGRGLLGVEEAKCLRDIIVFALFEELLHDNFSGVLLLHWRLVDMGNRPAVDASFAALFGLRLKLWKLQVFGGWLFGHRNLKPFVLEWEVAPEFVLVAVAHFDSLARHVMFQNTIVNCGPWLLGIES